MWWWVYRWTQYIKHTKADPSDAFCSSSARLWKLLHFTLLVCFGIQSKGHAKPSNGESLAGQVFKKIHSADVNVMHVDMTTRDKKQQLRVSAMSVFFNIYIHFYI